jgi:hypothetical protein
MALIQLSHNGACSRRTTRVARATFTALLSAAGALTAVHASALDKQGAAHAGADAKEAAANKPNLSGSVLLGAALYNPSYAARPDNSGLALFRYALHADVDVIGQKLSFPLDVNLFTDSTRHGGLIFVPTEGDVIAGVTSTWPALKGSIELGLRFEHDRPLDRTGFSQTYVDFRGRYMYSLAAHLPKVRDMLGGGDLRGWATVGTFLFNPSYAARPDNTGLALFRYAAHSELSFWSDHVAVAVDSTYFTARERQHFVPTELDLTLELIGHYKSTELHIAYERDMPVGSGGLVQQFVYMLAGYNFDFKAKPKSTFAQKNQIPST